MKAKHSEIVTDEEAQKETRKIVCEIAYRVRTLSRTLGLAINAMLQTSNTAVPA